jgi:lipid II:glycine glycyltransferase (peptidoglycan interpeptide bridge formation enzyme)
MNDKNITEWKSGEIFQDDEYASLYAKHRKYMVIKILGNTCFLMKRPIVGIVKAKVYYNNGNVNEFIDECYRLSKEKNIPHIEIYTSITDKAFSQFPYKTTGTYVIDLNEDIETLWGKLSRSTKKKIRQAKKRNVKIEILNIENDFLDWWGIYINTVNRKKFISESPPFPKELFENKKLSRLFVAKIDDRIVSGWFILLFENGIISKLSASNREYSRYHPGDLLIWKLIEWAKKQGYSYYDMGGALPPRYDKNGVLINEGHGEGPSAFKKKFGGDYRDIYKYQIITNKTKYRIIKELINARFKLIKHL